MSRIYLCREGVAGSAIALDKGAEPTEQEWATLAEMGLTRAKDGQRYVKRVCCPVNGDGYEYIRVELLDSNGCIVGSRREDES